MYPAGEFVDFFGRDHAPLMREYDGSWWYPKDRGRAELLAHVLAAGRINLAEVRPAPSEWVMSPNAVMVRLGQQYRLEDLPIRHLDEAVAAELVFSLWIRRRDTHAFNRVYVEGVPVFFDHHIAFGAEEASVGVEGFFRDGAGGPGWVPSWRVEQIRNDRRPETLAMRDHNRATGLAIHAIDDPQALFEALARWTEEWQAIDLGHLETTVSRVGYRDDEVGMVCNLLRQSQVELAAMVGRMRRMLLGTHQAVSVAASG